jgi:hypothetical protein
MAVGRVTRRHAIGVIRLWLRTIAAHVSERGDWRHAMIWQWTLLRDQMPLPAGSLVVGQQESFHGPG